jgi:hypothetical protein
VHVGATLRKTAVRPSAMAPDGIRKCNLQLPASILATALYAVALVGCAPDHGRNASKSYIAHDSAVVRPAEAFPNTRLSRTAKVFRTANTSTSIKARLRTPISLPDQALLIPQPEPDCEFRPSPTDPDGNNVKLDYERQCYRQAEIIVRTRLRLLQTSVGEMIKAAILGRTADPRPAAPSKTEAPQKPQ